MNLRQIVNAIQAIEQMADIDQVLDVAQAQRAWLVKRNQKGKLYLTLVQETWYALRREDPERRGFKIGKRLGMAAMLRLAREPAPDPKDYAISKEQAMQMRSLDPSSVGRWEERDGTAGYYRQAEYQEAYSNWLKGREHLKDERASILRLDIEGMKQLHRIEAHGYTVLMEDE